MVVRFRQATSLLLITHARPDGDGLGSMAALAISARQQGKRARTLVPDKVPQRYAFLFGEEQPACGGDFADIAASADLIIILDTCSFTQLDSIQPQIRAAKDRIVVIDHHVTSDDVGSLRWLDPTAAAAGVMTAELLDVLGWPLSQPAAEALATAVTSDTGWLRFANTDPRCLRVMADLLEAGVRPDRLYAKLFQCDRPQRLALVGRMLATMELHYGDRLAVMAIRKSDFAATGAQPEETENLVNEALRIGSVESAVLMVEHGDLLRVSLRSRDRVDVAAVARIFGGGGHARAAGVRVSESIETFKAKLVAAFAALA